MLILNLMLINLFIIFFVLLVIYAVWQNNNKITGKKNPAKNENQPKKRHTPFCAGNPGYS